eukprot:TRINITY_DN3650_c0_g3_i1.p1 TRINITY_DN3650_c0_g3~~TRINITY_DN3650_c0_g3_i1.p1  ORF type:complete len:332 (-),score=41.15 TRINITY_DN3650_c0_g3_i1:105-1100(-)
MFMSVKSAASILDLSPQASMNLIADAVLCIPVAPLAMVPGAGVTYDECQTRGVLALAKTDGGCLVQIPFVVFYAAYNLLSTNPDYRLILAPLRLSVNDKLVYWQDWEEFNIQHLALRSNLLQWRFNGQQIPFSWLLRGARFDDAFSSLQVRCTGTYCGIGYANHRFPTSTSLSDVITGETLHWDDGTVIRNGDGAPFADFWKVWGDVILLGQGKFYTGSRSVVGQADFVNERDKCKIPLPTVVKHSCFAVFTTGAADVELPDGCALVSKSDFACYYGSVFADRATFAYAGETVNVNTALVYQLESVDGIGNRTAIAIKRAADVQAFKVGMI